MKTLPYEMEVEDLVRYFNILSPKNTKSEGGANCGTGAGGFKPGNTCAKGGGGGPVKDEQGNYNPGTMGKISGVDTSKWDKAKTYSQWAMQKIHKMEQLFEKGDYDKLAKMEYKDYSNYNKLSPPIKGVVDAFNNLKAKHGQQVVEKPAIPAPSEGGMWKKLGDKLGTMEGGLYEFGGKKYYVKFGDEGMLKNELLAQKLYNLAGGHAVNGEMVMINGKKGLANEWTESAKMDWDNPAAKQNAAQDFAIHAWLNNRDAIGAGSENPMDNIRYDYNAGKQIMIDAGGSMAYKGMGGKKEFGHIPSEFESMRNPALNPTMAKVFGGMTNQQLVDSINKLNNMDVGALGKLVGKYGPSNPAENKALLTTLLLRKQWLESKGEELAKGIALEKIIAAVPPPPASKSKTAASWEPYFNKIYDAAKTGDVSKVEAIKTNPNPNADHYYVKIHQYKQQVLGAMKSGGAAQTDHVTKPQAPPAPKVDPSKFPKVPNFVDKNYAAKNKIEAEAMLKMAQAGDINTLKNVELPPSGKLKAFHNELVGILSNQLNPPVPPKKLAESISQVVEKVKQAKAGTGEGLKKIGEWMVHTDIGGVPTGIPSGTWHSDSSLGTFWSSGQQAITKAGVSNAVYNYTGSGYGEINKKLRAGNVAANTTGVKLGKAIVNHGVDLPVGMILSRKHGDGHGGGFGSLKVGQVLSEKGILSTSTSETVWSGKVQWKLTIGPGVKGLPVKNGSSHKSEKEVLLAPNQKILVTKVENKNGSIVAHAVVLPTEPNQCC